MKKVLIFCIGVILVTNLSVAGLTRDSADFVGYSYEGNSLPSAAIPVWDIQSASPSEGAVASSDGQYLAINVLAAGSVGYCLPGTYGAEMAPVGNRNYTQGVESNPWQPDFNIGYTLEISTQVLGSSPGTWGYSLYFGEAYHGALFDLQIFADRITSSSLATPLYVGDLTTGQNKIRLVRYAGAMDDPSANPYVELYVGQDLVYTGGKVTDGGIMSIAAWNQDWLFMGSLSGAARYHVVTDYIRADFTGAYTPVPEPASIGLIAMGVLTILRKQK